MKKKWTALLLAAVLMSTGGADRLRQCAGKSGKCCGRYGRDADENTAGRGRKSGFRCGDVEPAVME